MRSAAILPSRPAALGILACLAGILVVAGRAALLGSQPGCGTGSTFLAPLAWMLDLGTVTFLVASSVGAALLLLGRETRLLLGYAIALAAAAVLVTAWSGSAAGCDRAGAGTYAVAAALAAGTAALTGCAVALLLVRAIVRRSGVDQRPLVGPRTRIVGHYTVRSGAAAPSGTRAWAVVSPSELTLIGIGGRVLGRVPRAALEVSVVGERVIVLVEDRPWAVLVPDPDTDAFALGTELFPGRPRPTAGTAA